MLKSKVFLSHFNIELTSLLILLLIDTLIALHLCEVTMNLAKSPKSMDSTRSVRINMAMPEYGSLAAKSLIS